MITFEVHPEIHVRELRDHPSFSTCSECHRRFHAKSEDQLSVSLCQRCFALGKIPFNCNFNLSNLV